MDHRFPWMPFALKARMGDRAIHLRPGSSSSAPQLLISRPRVEDAEQVGSGVRSSWRL